VALASPEGPRPGDPRSAALAKRHSPATAESEAFEGLTAFEDAEGFTLGEGGGIGLEDGGGDILSTEDAAELVTEDDLFAESFEDLAVEEDSPALNGETVSAGAPGEEEFSLDLDGPGGGAEFGLGSAGDGQDLSLDDLEQDFFLEDEPVAPISTQEEEDLEFSLEDDGSLERGAMGAGSDDEALMLHEEDGFGLDPEAFVLEEDDEQGELLMAEPLIVDAIPPVAHAAQAPAPPTAVPEDDPFADELEEARFFLEQQLEEDARSLLEEILEQRPDHAEALDLLDRIGGVRGVAGGVVGGRAAAEDEAEFGQSLGSIAGELDTELESVREGEHTATALAGDIGREDSFDVGTAYHGMGMFDEAIREFEKAADLGDEREADCLRMVGVSLSAKGDPKGAVRAFKRGLHVPGATDAQKLELYYELGRVLEELGRSADARNCFVRVHKRKKGYRDVAERLRRLQ